MIGTGDRGPNQIPIFLYIMRMCVCVCVWLWLNGWAGLFTVLIKFHNKNVSKTHTVNRIFSNGIISFFYRPHSMDKD